MENPGHWLGKAGFYGSKLNLIHQLTGIDMGRVLFDKLAERPHVIKGSEKVEEVPVWPPVRKEDLGDLRDIIDGHYKEGKPPVTADVTGNGRAVAVHMRNRIGIEGVKQVVSHLDNWMPTDMPVVLVGSGATGPLVESLVKADDNQRLHGIALNAWSKEPDDRVLYVRHINDINSAMSRHPDHDYVEYY